MTRARALALFTAVTALGLGLGGAATLAFTRDPAPITPARAPATDFFAKRCLSMGGLEHEPVEGSWAEGRRIQRGDFAIIKAGGFDTVRLAMNFERAVSDAPPYRLDETYFRRVEEVIGWALNADLKVIVAPLNQVSVHEDPARGGPKLIATWRQLAQRWETMPSSVAFAPLNEPNTNLDGPKANALYAQLIATIRPRHRDRWLLISPTHWGSPDGLTELVLPRADRRLIVDVHYYAPHPFTHSGADWIPADRRPPAGRTWPRPGERAELARDIDTIARWSAQSGFPVFLGEFGVDNGLPLAQRAAWSGAVRQTLDQAAIPWCYYSFTPSFWAWNYRTGQWIPEIYRAVMGSPPPAPTQLAGLRGRG